MSQALHSLRMHASRGDYHVSGGERLLVMADLEEAASVLFLRALNHPRGAAEQIFLTIQPVEPGQVRQGRLLPLTTHTVGDWQSGRQLAAELLVKLGINRQRVEQSIAQLAAGPAPRGGVMRGAMLVNSVTGERLEPDPARGVRVSRMDVASGADRQVRAQLAACGLDHRRVIEAWVLASKVALFPEIIAELCWSDDPDYLTGYVASAQHGYQRISLLKEAGSDIGGRVFFVRPGADLDKMIRFLQLEPVLFYPPDTESDH